ncbi:endonuclease/exonuclease/phosphatase family protein [Georgenia sp. 10Sc9-8]|uniref:Endonuclease/exonuclease/phosphatase family protein n=1 Tax=Georgenia halotolerans TaxID=3028317 RepID=A0ABT5TYD5_9MICO|nr:endonuclease/exonuclease/phosphatase family protein [Georgenia halotolerans]
MSTRRTVAAAAVALAAGAAAAAPAVAAPPADRGPQPNLRVATYNASLNRATEGELVADLSTPDNGQAQAVAEVVQITEPDVLLLNEFDYDAGGVAADLFRDNYLEVSQGGQDPVEYPYAYSAPVNTGVPSGFDLNNDGSVGGPDDAWGFGFFPGQYGMLVLSKYPIATEEVRTFQEFRWQDMPGNVIPDDWYTAEELAEFPLSSKSHWDVPIEAGTQTIHVLAAHPTPPTFDGPEDRNGRRNHDEIRFWADYVAGAEYIYDDAGVTGGLKAGERFVIAGDYNADPYDGDSYAGAIDQLLDHRRIQDPLPTSAGAVEAAELQGGANEDHEGDPAYDTADFNDDPAPGNLRADYVLPSRNLRVVESGVFWPEQGQPGSELTGTFPFPTSDHRPVWVDLRVPGGKDLSPRGR